MSLIRDLLRLPLAALAVLSLSAGLTACTESEEDDDDDKVPTYTIPSDYSTFEGVDYSGQTARLDMLSELGSYMKSGNTKGTVLDADKMKAMFANSGAPFAKASLNTSGKQLKDKTFEPDRAYFEALFDSAAAASKADTSLPAAQGRAGLSKNAAGTRTYLVSSQGHEYAQLFEKGMMGSLSYYQAMAVYTDTATKLSASLTDSARAHHWDEAYGYFTDSLEFPAKGRNRFWSSYSNQRDAVLGSNALFARAFAKGRAAIGAKDRKGMVEAIDSLRYVWERVMVGSAIHYLLSVRKSLADEGARNHELSEGLGFLRGLRCSPARRITDAQLAEVESHIGADFYEVTAEGLDKAITVLEDVYKFGDLKDKL